MDNYYESVNNGFKKLIDEDEGNLLESIMNEEVEDLEWERIWGPDGEDMVCSADEFDRKIAATRKLLGIKK